MTVLLIFKTSQSIFNQSTARFAELITGLYPPLIYYCTKFVPTTIFLFLLSLTIYLLLSSDNRIFLHSLFTGIVSGLTILCEPVALAIYPSIFLWFFIKKKINFFKMLLIIIFSFIILVPWTIRNYNLHKKFIPVTTQFGVNFWIGNNPSATGTDYYNVKSIEREEYILMTHTLPFNVMDSLSKMTEIERTNFYIKDALNFIRREPVKFVALTIKKFYYYFWFAPSSVYSSKDLEKFRLLFYFFYFPVLISGITGIVLSIKNRKDVLLILFLLFFISCIYIFTHVGLIRYRLPVELYLLIFSAYLLKSWRK